MLLVVGPMLLIIGTEADPQSDALILAGALLWASGGMFFTTFHVPNAMAWVQIKEDGVYILDGKGQAYRSVEYRHILNVETRMFQVTEISSEQSKNRYPPTSGIAIKAIMIYINGVRCFDDLKLRQLGKKGEELYWCDQIFRHNNCFAFVYDEGAWNQLMIQIEKHSSTECI